MVCLWILFAAYSILPANTPPTSQDSLWNTLVSGVIINKNCTDRLIDETISVRIYKNGIRIAEVEATDGMFAKDLLGEANPEDLIEVVVWRGRDSYGPIHSGKTIRTYLQRAQNLIIPIGYRNKRYGCYRRGTRILFINNI